MGDDRIKVSHICDQSQFSCLRKDGSAMITKKCQINELKNCFTDFFFTSSKVRYVVASVFFIFSRVPAMNLLRSSIFLVFLLVAKKCWAEEDYYYDDEEEELDRDSSK